MQLVRFQASVTLYRSHQSKYKNNQADRNGPLLSHNTFTGIITIHISHLLNRLPMALRWERSYANPIWITQCGWGDQVSCRCRAISSGQGDRGRQTSPICRKIGRNPARRVSCWGQGAKPFEKRYESVSLRKKVSEVWGRRTLRQEFEMTGSEDK